METDLKRTISVSWTGKVLGCYSQLYDEDGTQLAYPIALLSSASGVRKVCSIDGGDHLNVTRLAGRTARIAALTGVNSLICLLVAGSTPSHVQDIRIASELETTRGFVSQKCN